MKKNQQTGKTKTAGWNKQHARRARRNSNTPEVQIETLTNAGDGLGRIEQRVVFVPYTMAGDHARIRIVQDKKNFLLGQLIELSSPSPDRIEPACPYFTLCGGCDWQHIPYHLQLAAKAQQLQDTMTRIADLPELPIAPIIESGSTFHYRNRIQGQVRDGKFYFQRKRDGDPVAIEQCAIADPRINQWLKDKLDSQSAGPIEIAVVDDAAEASPLSNRRTSELGFRQVNTSISNKLNALILENIATSDCTTLFDLYCGRGTWSIDIAKQHPTVEVIGIDSMAENIQAANNAAQQAGVRNVRFTNARVENVLGKLDLQDGVCIVDPPRAGLDTVVCDALCKTPVQQLIYVSCHPASLARDLKKLVDSGYEVRALQPLDMFPQTAHLECFVVLHHRVL